MHPIELDAGALALARANFAQIPAQPAERQTALSSLCAWYRDYPAYRAQMDYHLEQEQWSFLFDAFYRVLPFGTGGRRGPVGIGPNRFNPITLSSSVQGHVDYLRAHHGQGQLCVVVAYDVRQFLDLRALCASDRPNPLLELRSSDFARIAAEVYAANGVDVYMPGDGVEPLFLTTPEMSFSIRSLGTLGGLYISASHNHPDDNGGKLFNQHGGQEVPPRDNQMAEFVARVETIKRMDFREARQAGLIKSLPPQIHADYITLSSQQGADSTRRSARVAFTPLHGTGRNSVYEALLAAGFDVQLTPQQADFDGRFPTVPFRAPNPEVPESMQLAVEHARTIDADIVMSCDPDADRIGMFARDRRGNYQFINGNELSTLATHYRLRTIRVRNPDHDASTPLVISTEVTTGLLRVLAGHFGAAIIDDLLVGFKYHGAVLNEIEDTGAFGYTKASIDDFAIATEESHGLLLSAQIRDKDAAGAAVLLAELASVTKDHGDTVIDYLHDIYREHGYYCNQGTSLVMAGALGTANIRRIQASLRKTPPGNIDGLTVASMTDHLDETGRFGAFKGATDRASRDMLVFHLEDGSRVIVRPSGTEPKNKSYIEVQAPALGAQCTAEQLQAQINATKAKAKHLAEAFSRLMLERIDIILPVHALRLSGLVSLDCRIDFAERFLAELEAHTAKVVTGGEGTAAASVLESARNWADTRLASYGKDPRALVAGGVASYVEECRADSRKAERQQQLDFITRLFA